MPKTSYEIKSNSARIIQIMPVPVGPYVSKEAYGWDFLSKVNEYNKRCAQVVYENNKKRNYSLIHSHDWLTVNAALEAKAKINKPNVITIHSTEYDRAGLSPYEEILKVEKKGVLNSDRVITVSHMMEKQLIERFGADKNKLRVIYNGVDIDKFRKRYEFRRSKEKVVLFLGRMVEQKAPIQFLEAARKVLTKMRNVRFVMVGEGDLLPHLIDLAIKWGISDKVTFMGYLPDEQLKEAYARSDLYVMPSVSEPFGITVLEAMASGTPVLVSKTSGVSEITAHVLKTEFWDVNDMAEKIIALLNYDVLSETLSNGHSIDVKNFTWDKTAEQTLNVYKELV
jgi:glycosyltransferase involved in cell wall biosynthesis